MGNRPPVWRMRKVDIVKLARWRCQHGETGLSHYNCWLRSNPETERIGFLDIETSNLKADYGIILTYAIKVQKQDKIYQRTISQNDLRTCLDEKVVRQLIRDLVNFDRVVTYYGTGFDLKFIRTRALALGIEFPEFGQIYHNDVYYLARNRLCISSNRLDNVCRALFGETQKTRIASDKWIKALMGDRESLDYIAEHCRYDVIELERVYDALINYGRKTDKSI